MITKQAIRRGVTIICNGEQLNKEEVIDLGKNWTEKEENFFRKMLKQGGRFVFQGNKFEISVPENLYNSKGEIEATLQEHEEE
jgi:hypothetical protein